jgi:hypothetical protein
VPSPDTRPIARVPFAYATIRIVPRVDREEFVNAGVVLYSRPRRFLGVRTLLDRVRLLALWPGVDLDGIDRQLHVLRSVAMGDPASGKIAGLPQHERFGWLTAPASTVVQPGPVHAGLTSDPESELDDLFHQLVAPPLSPRALNELS